MSNLFSFSDSYLLTSNRESGDGRYDIQLKPKNREYYSPFHFYFIISVSEGKASGKRRLSANNSEVPHEIRKDI